MQVEFSSRCILNIAQIIASQSSVNLPFQKLVLWVNEPRTELHNRLIRKELWRVCGEFDLKTYHQLTADQQRRFLLKLLSEEIKKALDHHQVDRELMQNLEEEVERRGFQCEFTGKKVNFRNLKVRVCSKQGFDQANLFLQAFKRGRLVH